MTLNLFKVSIMSNYSLATKKNQITMILCDHGGQEAKKTSKKAPENGIFSKIQLKQLPITFVRHDPKPFKSYQCAQLLYGNKKEPNNHDSMCSWGSGDLKNIKKSSRKLDFFTFRPLVALYIYINIYI